MSRAMSNTTSVQSALRVVVMTLVLGGCSSSLPLLPAPTQQAIMPESLHADAAYTLGPADELNVIVYGHEDLSTHVVVSPEGAFTYPLLGVIRASGLTVQQLEGQIAAALSKYVVSPQVSVTVTQFRSQRVYVMGEVRAPGAYALQHATTLLEILSRAGGPTPNAGWEVVLVRKRQKNNGAASEKGPDMMSNGLTRVDMEDLLAGRNQQPITVSSGNTIYVPPAAFFYVSGQVREPGRYRLERGTTVAKAITVAGGMTRFAAKTRLKVRRLMEGGQREFSVRMTDLLQAKDELIVPESVF